jgi:hypothetical protein
MIPFRYTLSGSDIGRTDTVKDLGVFLDSKLYFYQILSYTSSQALNFLGLICSITFSFSII